MTRIPYSKSVLISQETEVNSEMKVTRGDGKMSFMNIEHFYTSD